MHRLLICAMVLLGAFSFAPAEDTRPKAKYSAPSETLDLPLAKLEELKGKGLPVYSTSASGKELSQVEYAETWFELPDPVNAQFLVFSEAPQTVHQITLGFKDAVKRDDIIAAASKSLGTAEQRKSEPDAPSKYYAQWVKDGVRYDFQDYGDYREMYIAWAQFSYSEKYKLKEPIYIVSQLTANLTTKGVGRRVMLLGKRAGNDAKTYDNLWFYACNPAKEEDGKLLALPKPDGTTLWNAPEILTDASSKDGVQEVRLAVQRLTARDPAKPASFTLTAPKGELVVVQADAIPSEK